MPDLRRIARGVWISLKVILRRTPVFLSIASITALSTILTLAFIAVEYPEVSEGIIAGRLKPSLGLVVSSNPPLDAIICHGVIIVDGRELEIPVVVPNGSKLLGLLGVRDLKGGVIIGYHVFKLANLNVGNELELLIKDTVYKFRLQDVRRFNNFMDLTVIANVTGVNCNYGYRVSEYNPLNITSAISLQFTQSLTQWYYVSLLALLTAIIIALLKSIVDLDVDIRNLLDQGLPLSSILLALSLSFSTTLIAGFSYGFVLFSIIASTLGSYMGIYMPPPPLTLELLVRVLLAPLVFTLTTPIVVGGILWRLRGS